MGQNPDTKTQRFAENTERSPVTEVALEALAISKKFRKGETYGSLRDFIPALLGQTFSIGANGLRKKEFWALKDVNFEVKKGEAFAIIGPNGAGKSTMLKLLSGIIRPTKGEMRINGRLSALIEVGAGFHQDLTGRENIFLNGIVLGMKKEEIKRKFDEIVEFSGLGEFIDTPVKRYSSGMYARLGFSVAAHVDPDVLLVDEVLSVGDYTFQKKCIERMKSVINGNSTVIFVSHNLKAVSDLCSRGLLLNGGSVEMIGRTTDIIQAYVERANPKKGAESEEKEAFISKVVLRNEKEETIAFSSGQKAWVDVEVGASAKCEGLAIVLYVTDNGNYEIFNVSTQRMGYGTFSMNPGDVVNLTFELNLHLATGSYHLGVLIYQSVRAKVYDELFPVRTIFINSDEDVRGVANLHPKIIIERVLRKN